MDRLIITKLKWNDVKKMKYIQKNAINNGCCKIKENTVKKTKYIQKNVINSYNVVV